MPDKVKYLKWRTKHLGSFLKELPKEVASATFSSLGRGEFFEALITPVALPAYALIFYLSYFDEHETPPWKKPEQAESSDTGS